MSELLMFQDLGDFVVQGITGPIMALIRTNNEHLINENVIIMLYHKYLNDTWHVYNKKTDDYIVNQYNKIMKHNVIKCIVCLMHWISAIGSSICRECHIITLMSNLNKINAIDNKRAYL